MTHPTNHNGGPPIDDRRNGNWFAVSRSVFSHHVVGAGQPVTADDPKRGSYSRMEAWLDLIAMASYEPTRVSNKGSEMELMIGQAMASHSYLAHRWNWTPKTVRGYLQRLQVCEMITRHCEDVKASRSGTYRGNQSQIITVCNYENYQIVRPQQGQPERQPEGNPRASEGQAEGKNLTLKHLNTNPSPSADELARQAYLDGLRIKGGATAKSARATAATVGELDGSGGVRFQGGKLSLLNGTAQAIASEFPNIDLAAVCNKAAPEISRTQYPTTDKALAIIRKWAQYAVDDAAKAPRGQRANTQQEDSKEFRGSRWARKLEAKAEGRQ